MTDSIYLAMDDRKLKKLGYKRGSGQLAVIDLEYLTDRPEKVLEVVRLAVELGLEFETETKSAIEKAACKLSKVPPAKLGPEWHAFAAIDRKRPAIELLDEVGGVKSLLPEVFAMKGVEQPPQWHPEGDVWIHTLLSLEYLGKADAFLTTATLLHDVGKPPTFEVSDRIRFSKHDSIGGRMAHEIALRLGFTGEEAADMEWIVRAHMRFKHVREMRPGRLHNLVLDPRFGLLASIVKADCLASHGDTSDVEFALSARERALAEEEKPVPLMSGRDLLEMGFKQGPVVGEVLGKIEALRTRGKLKSFADAKVFAKNLLKNMADNE
jgi:poly(A) polymerase